MPRTALLPVAILALSTLSAQKPAEPDWQTAAGGKMQFEVASIKPTTIFKPPNFPLGPGDGKPPGGRMSAVFPLIAYITFAYKLNPGDVATPLPKSVPADQSYEIEAKAPGNPTKDEMRLMMQSLLAERFKLRAHFETTDGPVYALTLVRPGHMGLKLHPHSDGPACPDFELSGTPPNPKDVFPPVCGMTQMRGGKGGTLIGGRDLTMETIAAEAIHGLGSIAGEVDKQVIDQTGLKGRYDFTLELPAGAISIGPAAPPTDQPSLSPFIAAMRAQLGLKLVSTRGPIRKLVVDHAEQPSGN